MVDSSALADFSLHGKAALVIGAEQVLGQVAAQALAEAGADIVAASQEPGTGEQLTELSRTLSGTGRKVMIQVQSAATRADLRASLDMTVRELGSLDIVVNACDYRRFGPANLGEDSNFDRMIDNTLRPAWIACQEAGRIMIRRGGGSIVNIVSVLAERGLPNASLYCASQAAILSLTRSLALEWAEQRVRVNALEFGWLESQPQADSPARRFQDELLKYLPGRQLIKAEDLAGALLYLVSPGAEFMTGQAIAVDGGLLARP
jgi:NAD(P)-dependent dehydrogenase (short-subunit alcohol dehydrogenase family)